LNPSDRPTPRHFSFAVDADESDRPHVKTCTFETRPAKDPRPSSSLMATPKCTEQLPYIQLVSTVDNPNPRTNGSLLRANSCLIGVHKDSMGGQHCTLLFTHICIGTRPGQARVVFSTNAAMNLLCAVYPSRSTC